MPEVFEPDRRCRIAHRPKKRDHFTERPYAASIPSRTSDQVGDEIREEPIIRPSFHHELSECLFRVESNEPPLRHGESQIDARLDPVELAAYTALAGVILNLDEAITKE